MGPKQIRSGDQYRKAYRAGLLPEWFPASPDRVYARTAEWKGWPQFLDNRNFKGGWLDYEEARCAVAPFGLKSSAEWKEFFRDRRTPVGVPRSPSDVYRARGQWRGWGHFLQTGRRSKRVWASYKESQRFASSLGLKGCKDWRNHVSKNEIPSDIPTDPEPVYKWTGEWHGWGEFLGTGRTHKGHCVTYDEMEAFVRSLGVTTVDQWISYHRAHPLPAGIPKRPQGVYSRSGEWRGWGALFGTRNLKGGWLPYDDTKRFIRSLGLKSSSSWQDYVRDHELPAGVPKCPDQVYRRAGVWEGWGVVLGTGRMYGSQWLSCDQAKKAVAGLGLVGQAAWREYARSHAFPAGVPRNHEAVYKRRGEWVSWGDFLCTGNKRRKFGV